MKRLDLNPPLNLEVVERPTVYAREFDAALQRDRRPMEFVAGPAPPAPQTRRTAELDLSAWREWHAP